MSTEISGCSFSSQNRRVAGYKCRFHFQQIQSLTRELSHLLSRDSAAWSISESYYLVAQMGKLPILDFRLPLHVPPNSSDLHGNGVPCVVCLSFVAAMPGSIYWKEYLAVSLGGKVCVGHVVASHFADQVSQTAWRYCSVLLMARSLIVLRIQA